MDDPFRDLPSYGGTDLIPDMLPDTTDETSDYWQSQRSLHDATRRLTEDYRDARVIISYGVILNPGIDDKLVQVGMATVLAQSLSNNQQRAFVAWENRRFTKSDIGKGCRLLIDSRSGHISFDDFLVDTSNDL